MRKLLRFSVVFVMAIRWRLRRTTVALLVVSTTPTRITCGPQADVCARVITQRVFPESDSHQRLQQRAEIEVVCFMQTPCLDRKEKKPLALAVSGEDNLNWSHEHLTFFRPWQHVLLNVLLIIISRICCFYGSSFQIFQIFPGRCPEPRFRGLHPLPKTPTCSEGRLAQHAP